MQKVPCYWSRTVTVDVDQINEFSTQPTSFELESHPSKSKSVSNTCKCELNRALFKIPIQNHALFRFCKYVHVQAHLDYCLKNAFSCLFSGLLNHLRTRIQMVQHGKQVVDFSGNSSRDTLCNPGEFIVQGEWLPWLWQLDWECPWTFAAEIWNMGHLQCRWNKFVL